MPFLKFNKRPQMVLAGIGVQSAKKPAPLQKSPWHRVPVATGGIIGYSGRGGHAICDAICNQTSPQLRHAFPNQRAALCNSCPDSHELMYKHASIAGPCIDSSTRAC